MAGDDRTGEVGVAVVWGGGGGEWEEPSQRELPGQSCPYRDQGYVHSEEYRESCVYTTQQETLEGENFVCVCVCV